MWYFLFFSVLAMAEGDPRNLAEKTFPRDNTFCSLKDKRIEVQIKGHTKVSEPKEKVFGDYFFYLEEDHPPQILPLNKDRFDSYRFYPGTGTNCSKSLGFALDNSTLAVLFLRENRPFKEKLSLQLFDMQKMTAKDAIDSPYIADKVKGTAGGFVFKSLGEKHDIDMGTTKIEGQDFIYQDRDFTPWVKFSTKGFEVLPDLSYKKFKWKKLFKDEKEFLEISGWSAQEKKFTKTSIYMAVNHALKKECIVFKAPQEKLQGNESWRCRQTK